MKDRHNNIIVELVDVLSKIEVTPAKIKKNQGMMSDNNGRLIDF